jgi:hypothetical protein
MAARTADGPFKETFGYDAFGNTTSLASRVWSDSNTDTWNYTANRNQYFGYDADGWELGATSGAYIYDIKGSPTTYKAKAGWVGGFQTGNPEQPGLEVATNYDVAGAPAKRVETDRSQELIDSGPATHVDTTITTTYYLRSTALGGKLVAD